MGGSSLAPEVFRRSFGTHADGLILHVLDSTDADAVRDVEAEIDVAKALFVVSSKSGGTIETLSAFHYFWEKTGGNGAQFVAITDPGSGLAALGERARLPARLPQRPRHRRALQRAVVLRHRPGRAARRRPARAAGRRGGARRARCATPTPPPTPASGSAARSASWRSRGRDKLTFVVDPPIESFGLWVEQLIAESTGKHGKGVLPVADEPLGAPEAYGDDRVFLHLHDAAARRGRRQRRRRRAPRRAPASRSSRSRAHGAGRPRAHHGSSSSSRPRSPAGCWRSTRSTSPTCRRPRTRRNDVLAMDTPPAIAEADADALRDAAATPARRPTWRSWATSRPRPSSTARSPSCAR